MIYIDDKKVTDLAPYVEKLKTVFPSFFEGKPIFIRFSDELRYKVTRRTGVNSNSMQQQIKTPLPVGVKTVSSYVGEDGLSKRVAYTETPPTVDKKTDNVVYKNARIVIEDNKSLHNPTDLEKLIYLYFYSDVIANGDKPKSGATFSFVKTELEAKQRIEGRKLYNELESKILFGGVRIERINETLRALGQEVSSSEEQNRVLLFDIVAPSVKNINQRALAMFEAVANVTVDKEEKDSKTSIEDAQILVDTAIEKGLIETIDNGWRFTNQRGVNAQAFSGVCSVEELYTLVSETPKLVDRFTKALAV